MDLDYFYGSEAEQFTFYRIPKVLVTSPQFKKVSDSAKLLYGLMLGRMGLSIKNGWVDDENRAYIFFTTKDVMELMCCGTEKATKIFAELDSEKGIGLIERKKQGQGKPAIVYLKKFITNDTVPKLSQTENQDFGKSKTQTFDNRNSRLSQTESADFCKSKRNNNEYNNTDMSYINPSSQGAISMMQTDGLTDRYNKTIQEIKEQIGYEYLINTNDAQIIGNIINVMADVLLLEVPYYEIEGKKIPAELVRIRYRQIDYCSLEAFLIEFDKIYYKIKNTKAYLTTALYNIALTAETALTNRVNSNMYGGE